MTSTSAAVPTTVRRPAKVELVVLDMAGTTVADDGLVVRAFEDAFERAGLARWQSADDARQYVLDTMGQSKIAVFRHLTAGDEAAAQTANRLFEEAYGERAASAGVEEVPGAYAAITTLRRAGIPVVLTTGFSPETRDALLDSLGWELDGALSPADAGRGRPFPDMVLAAALAHQVGSVAAVVVAGDTASDMQTGRNAGAGFVVGVLSGTHDRATLLAGGADVVLDSVADLPGLLL